MPRKPATRSAVNPAGPVTHPSKPAGRSSDRTVLISPTVSATSPEESIGTKIWAASPSSETMGGEMPSCTPSRPAISSATVCTSAMSASESFPSPVTTTTAGRLSEPRKSGSLSLTCVASALCGRNDDRSFDETSDTLPKNGPPRDPPANQSRTRMTGMPMRSHLLGPRDV